MADNTMLILAGLGLAGVLLASQGEAVQPINTIDVSCPQSVEADNVGNVIIPILVTAPHTNTSSATKTIRLTIGSRLPITRQVTMNPGDIRTEFFADSGITIQTSFVTEVI